MEILGHLQMMASCICEPCYDFFHTICFCCGKRFRCQICGVRFKRLNQLSRHIRDQHDEVFSFGTASEFKRDDNKLYAKINTNDNDQINPVNPIYSSYTTIINMI
jgi:uncharacterized C2H2 Zn-finger protein